MNHRPRKEVSTHQTSRRRFLGQSGVFAAAGVMGGVHSSRVAGAASADETLRVCIVGLNGRGGDHIRGFNDDSRTTIAAVVDIDPAASAKRADQIEKMQGTRPKVYGDVRDAIQDDSIDIVSVATPNHWHALIGIWAMQAGKHVYVEKPISHNLHEGRALVETAKLHHRVFQTGTQCRSSGAIADAVKAIEEGKIGECRFARGLCYKRRKSIGPLGDYEIPADVDFDLWSGPATLTDPRLTRPQMHYDWHWQRHYGNGDLGNQGPHQTDIARWGLGLDRHPSSILTYGGRLGYDVERNDPDYVDAGDTANTEVSIYDYGDKQIVFETRGLDVTESAGKEVDAMFGTGPGNKIGVIFYGTDGFIAQTRYHEAKRFDRQMNLIETFSVNNVNSAHYGNFIDAVLAGDPAMVNADAMVGHLSAAVSHLGNISYYLGEQNRVSVEAIADQLGSLKSPTWGDDHQRTLAATADHLRANGVDLQRTPLSLGVALNFDPQTERFVDNSDADAMLTREYRSGFEVEIPQKTAKS